MNGPYSGLWPNNNYCEDSEKLTEIFNYHDGLITLIVQLSLPVNIMNDFQLGDVRLNLTRDRDEVSQ